jgi:cobalt/nickel transport system ATP-binding protein
MLDEFNAEGKTIIISTHDVDLASTWADEIYLLQEGSVYHMAFLLRYFPVESL